jgi:uncharacterized protein YjiS (DUF1127 family)
LLINRSALCGQAARVVGYRVVAIPVAVQIAISISDPGHGMANISATRPAMGRWLAGPIARILRWARSLSTREVLRALDDATLKDIGLTRGGIHRAAAEMNRGLRD